MAHHSLSSLIVVLGVAFIIPILLQRLHLKLIPVVVAEIAAGLLLGKSGLNVIQEDPWLELLSMLGFIFLMFLSGLELKVDSSLMNKTKKQKLPNPFVLGMIIFVLIMVISYFLSLSLVYFRLIEDPILMTLIITTVSLGVVLPILKERKLLGTHFGQTILMIAIIADFATMLLLTVFTMVRANEPMRIPLLLLLFIAVFFFYRFIKRSIRLPIIDKLMKTATVQLGTRGVFALMLLFVGLSESLGAEYIFGAFLAGIIIALVSPEKEFVHQLDSFGFGFFIPIFFVMVGARLDLQAMVSNEKVLILMPILLIYMYISKLIPIIILKKWYPFKKTIAAGVLSTSKLSLVIAAAAIALDLGMISEALNGALVLVAVTTCLVSPIIFNKLVPPSDIDRKTYTIIGANSITLPTAIDLSKENTIINIYSDHEIKQEMKHELNIVRVESYEPEELDKVGAFTADKVIIATQNEKHNVKLAHFAADSGVHDIVAKIEDSSQNDSLIEKGVRVFSTMRSSAILLKTLVNNPGMVTLLSEAPIQIQEVVVRNTYYDHASLSQLPFLGDALVLHIYRNGHFILPHGDTQILDGDHLLISGSEESLVDIERELA